MTTSKDKIFSWPVLQFQTLRRRHLRWALSLIYPLTENEISKQNNAKHCATSGLRIWSDLPSSTQNNTTSGTNRHLVINRTVTDIFRKLPNQKSTRRVCVLAASWNFAQLQRFLCLHLIPVKNIDLIRSFDVL